MIDEKLLEILVCPVPECRARLELRDEHLVCTKCRRRYPFEDRWPVLIPEEALQPDNPTENEAPI